MSTPPHIQALSPSSLPLSTTISKVLAESGADLSGAYLVVRAGVYRGRRYSGGEVLLCGGSSSPGRTVVLVARGLGRSRLGVALGERLLGDRGEACSEMRWQVQGRVLAVLRRAEARSRPATASAALSPHQSWVVVSTLAKGEEDAPGRAPVTASLRVVPRARSSRAEPARQLSLFKGVA